MIPLRFAHLCSALLFGCALAKADVVTDWNMLLLDAIRNESTSPPLAVRNLAIFHIAIYEAVNAIEGTHEPYLFYLTPLPDATTEAAAVGAAYECLADLYPRQIASFDAAFDHFLTSTPATPGRADGLMFGEMSAFIILSWRGADGFSTTCPYVPGTAPGDWRRTPPFFRPPDRRRALPAPVLSLGFVWCRW